MVERPENQAFLDGYAEEAIDEARSFLRFTLSLLASSPDETELEGVKTNDLYKFLNHIDNRLSEFEARKKLHF